MEKRYILIGKGDFLHGFNVTSLLDAFTTVARSGAAHIARIRRLAD